MNSDNKKTNQLKRELVNIVDNIIETQDFLELVENPQGTIRLTVDCEWTAEAHRMRNLSFNLTEMPKVYNFLIDAFREDMTYQAELIKQYGGELADAINDEIIRRRQG